MASPWGRWPGGIFPAWPNSASIGPGCCSRRSSFGWPPGWRSHAGTYAEFAEAWGLPLTYGLIVIWLYRNWKVPGLQVAAIGVTLNIMAVLLNQGKMPVCDGALFAAGLTVADLVG